MVRNRRTPIRRVTAIAVLVLSAAANADEPQGTIDTVTVEAERRREALEEQLGTFAAAITMSDPDESIARWQEPICLLVAGLPANEGKFVFQRLSQIASEAGVPLGSRGCAPNLRVVVTAEPEKVIKSWWSKNHQLFNTERGVAEIKHIIRTPAPVRIFHNECSVPAEMMSLGVSSATLCGEGGIADSRLRRATVRVIYSAIIVVDRRQTEGLELGPLTDYVAMSSLSHIRKNPDLGGSAPTILRLFEKSEAPRPRELSTWDRAFLKSLYEADPGRVTQLAEIKHRMKLELTQ